MAMSWEQHYRMEEQAEFARFAKLIEDALKKSNDGRNLDCWPLCSFGCKDADCDPCGCTGIKEIVGLDEDSITVKVGGHKTVSRPDKESLHDIAQELVCSCEYPGEWDECDAWTLYFEEDVRVETPWNDNLTDEQNIAQMAAAIKDKAREACQPFEESMAELSKAFEHLED